MSKYEDHIAQILLKEKVNFIKEKTFSDLRSGRYRYDFYLPDFNTLIECDGEQHFYKVNKFQKKERDFKHQQENDRRKNGFALANNIILYRIPYWNVKSIKSLNDIFSNETFRVKSKWHNDLLK